MHGRAARIHTKVITALGSTFFLKESYIGKKTREKVQALDKTLALSRHKAAPGRIRDHNEPSNKQAAKPIGGSHKQTQMGLCESKNLMSEFWEVAAIWEGMGPLQSHSPRTFVTLDAGHLQLQS